MSSLQSSWYVFIFEEEEVEEEEVEVALVKTHCVNIVDVRRIFPRDKLSVLYYQYFKIDPPIVRVRHLLFVTGGASLIHSSASLISLTLSPSAELAEGISSWSSLHLQTFKLLLRCEGDVNEFELRRTTTSRASVLFY